ncbi:hypothetical protein [uncultured Dokdonia sp.]|uniref:hypothetical protein n=1 Tax=uncultured Dokdonia sp. TaxID=575653 RepID=UPI002630E29B|nr:hypothetical protein [uncultured Dokdonia sp.]
MSTEENNTVALAQRFYPTLSSVVNQDEIPEILGFIKDGIVFLFDKIHFKDLQYSKSPRGDAAFYTLSIVTRDRIDIEVPGTGIFLVLNPDADDANISSFPITIDYEWKLLVYLRSFNLDQFDFSPKSFFETALRVLSISEEDAIANFINIFTEPVNDTTTALEQFVNDLNAFNTEANISAPTENTTLTDVVKDIYAKTQDYATIMAFGAYILTNDVEETKVKLKEFFRSLLPQDIEEYIKDLLLPKVKATLQLRAGVEFPRSILKPVYDEQGIHPIDGSMGEPLTEVPETDGEGNPKVLLSFGEALFYADTETGLGYNLDIVLNTNFPAQVGNTGLIIDIKNLKIDISTTENIIEADEDNRPPEFMGVYMERTDIFLPKKWFKKETGQTLVISGRKLLIGTGGMSGTIALRATHAMQDDVVTDYFSEYFDFNYPLTVLVNNTETEIPDYTALLAHVNTLDNPSEPKFQYPFTITAQGAVIQFNEEQQFFNYINALNPNKFMWFQLGSNPERAWRLGFDVFDLTFHHGQVIESNLHAQIEIPKFKGVNNPNEDLLIDLVGHWHSEDDFNLTAAFLPSGLPINLFNFMTLNLLTAELGKDEGRFYIGTSCQISFENNAIMQSFIGDQAIEIPQLRIYDNGSIEIVGGNGFIPLNISLNLGPVEMAVTGIHYGSTQLEHNGDMRTYNYWGFDGAISINPLGLDARGDGIKYYYTTDNDEFGGNGDSFIHVSSIEVNLVIPGTASPESAVAIINGALSLPDPGTSPEYTGEISLKLPKAKIAGGAAMRLAPRYPAFVIDAFIDLPAPIPIGPLGIYGFRGLLGFRYVAEKEAVGLVSGEDSWYDYYTYEPKGVHVEKMSGPERTEDYELPISLGAGAVLGTSFDGGTVFSVRTMLLLSMPTLFLLEGRGSILSARLGLTDDREPPFFAFFAWGDNSIEFGMGADFQIPDNGSILDIYAEAQMGFFFDNPSAWYVNFGTRDTPITAEILTILRGQSYLMLSAQGIEAGARLDFELRKRFGPAKVHILAYLEMGGFVSFERPQIGGYIAAGGSIDIDIWIVGVTLELDAIFSAEASKPFLIYAEVKLRVCAKIVFANVCKNFTVKLKWEKNKMVDRSPVAPLPFSTENGQLDRTEELVKGIHMLTNEAFDLDYLGVNISSPVDPSEIAHDAIIPLDTYIEFKAIKGLVPGAISNKIGGYTFPPEKFVDLIPPQRTVTGGYELRQVRHRYSIEDIEIKAWNGTWQDYHPFKAMVHEDNRSEVENLRIGYWQLKEKQYDTIRLLATTPFTYMEAGEPGWSIPEQYGITPSTLYCREEEREEDCANVLGIPLGTQYHIPIMYNAHFIDGAYFVLAGENGYDITNGTVTVALDDYMEVANIVNNHDFARSLAFRNENRLVIRLPEPSVKTSLKLTTDAEGVTVDYYRTIINDDVSQVQYALIESTYNTASQLSSIVEYTNDQYQISKVIITPKNCNSKTLKDIKTSLANLEKTSYANANGDVSGSSFTQSTVYSDLSNQLNTAKASCCKESGGVSCEKDDVVCDFYNILKTELYACIDAIGVPGGDDETKSNINIPISVKYEPYSGCFEKFIHDIEAFNMQYPEYDLLNLLQPTLGDLEVYPNGFFDDNLSTAVFMAELILAMIYELGNCDCDPKPVESCVTSLQEVCWLTLEDHQWNEAIPGSEAIEAEHQDMIDALQQAAQPIWRPNTTYYVKYTLKDEVDNGESEPGIYDYYYGFRTAGPLGHFHKHPNVNYPPNGATEEEYTLTSLRSYIDYKRSYPNANGNLLRAKPLFYGHHQCKIDLFFNKSLTEHMLNKWHPYLGMPELDGALHIAIKDPVTDVIVPYPLPADYNEESVPVGETFATWLEFESAEVLNGTPSVVTLFDNDNQQIGMYSTLDWQYLQISNKYHIRIDDDAILSENTDLIGGKVSWEINGVTIERSIIDIGQEDATWNIDNNPLLPPHIQAINNMIENGEIPCDIDLGDPIVPNSSFYTVTLTNLKPQKLYTALFYNAFEVFNGTVLSEPVHQFVFQTSRYADFKAQVESYIVSDDQENTGKAIYEIPVAVDTASINAAYALVEAEEGPVNDPWETQYLHFFDRATEGIFGINPLDPPATTEFNKVMNATTGDVIALLIKSPEPFNDPKIPLNSIKGTIEVVDGNGESSTAYKTLYSKDYSQVLIMHSSKKITTSALNIKFTYLRWEQGNEYVATDSVIVENILINE